MSICNEIKALKFNQIAFDVDGILLDTGTEIWNATMKALGQTRPLSDWITYDGAEILGLDKASWAPIYEPVLDRMDLPLLDGVFSALSRLSLVHDTPALCITYRRVRFKKATLESLKKGLPGIPLEVHFVAEALAEEWRSDKLPLLLEHNIKFYMEDCPLLWEHYIEAGVKIGTLAWPWTIKEAAIFSERYPDDFIIFDSWRDFYRRVCVE